MYLHFMELSPLHGGCSVGLCPNLKNGYSRECFELLSVDAKADGQPALAPATMHLNPLRPPAVGNSSARASRVDGRVSSKPGTDTRGEASLRGHLKAEGEELAALYPSRSQGRNLQTWEVTKLTRDRQTALSTRRESSKVPFTLARVSSRNDQR
jgi:hypothetical protein